MWLRGLFAFHPYGPGLTALPARLNTDQLGKKQPASLWQANCSSPEPWQQSQVRAENPEELYVHVSSLHTHKSVLILTAWSSCWWLHPTVKWHMSLSSTCVCFEWNHFGLFASPFVIYFLYLYIYTGLDTKQHYLLPAWSQAILKNL